MDSRCIDYFLDRANCILREKTEYNNRPYFPYSPVTAIKPAYTRNVNSMGSLPNRLCGACRRFNFKEMLEKESRGQDMGPLSDYGQPDYPFCKLIVTAVCRAGWDFVELCSSTTSKKKTPHIFIKSWSPMSVRNCGHIEHPEPRLQLALSQQPDEFQPGRPTVRALDRVKS